MKDLDEEGEEEVINGKDYEHPNFEEEDLKGQDVEEQP